MGNSFQLGKPFGIDLKLHWTFFLLPAWVLLDSLAGGGSALGAIFSVGLVLAVFACVALHELGHALAARQCGIRTRDIVLYPIGGVASLERMPKNPLQELWIAVAGPLVNVGIAGVLFSLLLAFPFATVESTFINQLAWINVGLVVFNMIPAFPMDGGRVLRAGLALFVPHHSATQVAATVGRIAAVGFAILGLVTGHFTLLLIAAFVYFAAGAEARQVAYQRQFGAGTEPQSQASPRPHPQPSVFRQQSFDPRPAISSDATALAALKWLVDNAAYEFRIIRDGRVVGAGTQRDLESAVAAGYGASRLATIFAL